MIGAVTGKTQEFLKACRKAGYERVTIFIHDIRVPDSCMIRKASTGWAADEDGLRKNPDTGKIVFAPNHKVVNCKGTYWGWGRGFNPFKIVCGAPNKLSSNGKPAMWNIVSTIDLHNAGAGHGNGHDVLCPASLTAGYYDLAELAIED